MKMRKMARLLPSPPAQINRRLDVGEAHSANAQALTA